ncbi:hypothetical protein D3C78_1541550 [compost metagenome]
MHQIGTLGVAPIHRPPFRVEGVMLIENVIFATEVHDPVRVVHPACRWGNMITGSIILNDARLAVSQGALRKVKGRRHGIARSIQRQGHRAPARTERKERSSCADSMACGWRFNAVPSLSNRWILLMSSCSSTRSPACHPALTSQRQISGSSCPVSRCT